MKCPNCGKSLWFVRHFCPFCKTQFLAPPRPKSVTVISCLAIVSGIAQAFVVLSPAARELMAGMSIVNRFLTFASIALLAIAGVVMLRGFNWARWTFVVTVAYNQLSKLFSGHWNASSVNVLGLLLVVTACYYLFHPVANAFFSGACSPDR